MTVDPTVSLREWASWADSMGALAAVASVSDLADRDDRVAALRADLEAGAAAASAGTPAALLITGPRAIVDLVNGIAVTVHRQHAQLRTAPVAISSCHEGDEPHTPVLNLSRFLTDEPSHPSITRGDQAAVQETAAALTDSGVVLAVIHHLHRLDRLHEASPALRATTEQAGVFLVATRRHEHVPQAGASSLRLWMRYRDLTGLAEGGNQGS